MHCSMLSRGKIQGSSTIKVTLEGSANKNYAFATCHDKNGVETKLADAGEYEIDPLYGLTIEVGVSNAVAKSKCYINWNELYNVLEGAGSYMYFPVRNVKLTFEEHTYSMIAKYYTCLMDTMFA